MQEQKQETQHDSSLVVCPSGLTGRVRKLRVGDFKLLGDRKAVQSGEAFDKVLDGCWTEAVDFGQAYSSGKFSWGEHALLGDRFAALLAIRRRTHGDTMEFDVQCSSPTCRRKFSWPINLSKLPVKPYPAESLRKHHAGEDFTDVVAGRGVTFRLPTGKSEKQMERFLRDSTEPLVDQLVFIFLTVEGLTDPKDKHAIRTWVNDMELDEMSAFRERYDAVNGGVETTLEVECPRKQCGHIQEVELPFGGQAFWTPKKRGVTGKPNTSSDAGSEESPKS